MRRHNDTKAAESLPFLRLFASETGNLTKALSVADVSDLRPKTRRELSAVLVAIRTVANQLQAAAAETLDRLHAQAAPDALPTAATAPEVYHA